jgi:hypothetical protein
LVSSTAGEPQLDHADIKRLADALELKALLARKLHLPAPSRESMR